MRARPRRRRWVGRRRRVDANGTMIGVIRVEAAVTAMPPPPTTMDDDEGEGGTRERARTRLERSSVNCES